MIAKAPHSPHAGSGSSAYRVMAMPWVVSAALHLLLVAAIVWMPQWTPERGRTISAINVTMVTLKDAPPGAPGPPSAAAPGPAGGKASKPAPAPEPKPAPAPKPEPAPVPPPKPEPAPIAKPVSPPKDAVSISPEKKTKAAEPQPEQKPKVEPQKAPEAKKPTKPEPPSPSSSVAKAIADLEKKVGTARPAAVDAAIDRLKASQGPSEAIDRLRKQLGDGEGEGEGGAGGRGPDGGGGGGGGGGGPLSIEDMYRLEVAYTVNKNWAFSESLIAGRTDLFAEVAFTVLPDGQISDVWFDRRSGNSYLDESAKRAILKSNPLPPHPQGVRRSFITVGLRFTPQGVLQ